MKRTTIFNLFILTFVLLFGVTACKKNPKGATPIPGSRTGLTGDGKSGIMDGGIIPDTNIDPSTGTIHAADPSTLEGRTQNRDRFAANTVHFDLDSATVKSSEASKIEAVANEFKSGAVGDLLIEGHCDERGTEGYNITLGDKRANAIREYLVNLGVSADRVHTVSFGEAQPADPGQGESAWAKNRRGEFIFVEPAK
jgi:peptidoglycan-associated lipoprotein